MNPIERLRATYEFKPLDRLVRQEFYIWDEAIERWKAEGMPTDVPRAELFGFDPSGSCGIGMLGWCEPEFVPPIEEAVLEDFGIASEERLVGIGERLDKFFTSQRSSF